MCGPVAHEVHFAGWWTLALRRDPDDREARQTLDRLVHEAQAPDPPTAPPFRSPIDVTRDL